MVLSGQPVLSGHLAITQGDHLIQVRLYFYFVYFLKLYLDLGAALEG